MCPLIEIPVTRWYTVFPMDVFLQVILTLPPFQHLSLQALPPRLSPPANPAYPRISRWSFHFKPHSSVAPPHPQVYCTLFFRSLSKHLFVWQVSMIHPGLLPPHYGPVTPLFNLRIAMNACSVALANCSACLQGPWGKQPSSPFIIVPPVPSLKTGWWQGKKESTL